MKGRSELFVSMRPIAQDVGAYEVGGQANTARE